jgi:serine/threonine protein phosphatase 1
MVTPSLAPAVLPPGERIYAIGDVHGCADQLDDLHRQIATDLAARPVADATVIHLGDYIDRGPDSAGVLDRLRHKLAGLEQARIINLVGNHEDMFLSALEGARGAGEHWLMNGGVAALESWQVPPRSRPADWRRLIPPEQVALVRGLAVSHVRGGYIFVHAGLRPGVKLADQTRQDMLWIREPFLSFAGALPLVAVHGHTPEAPHPVVRPHRIGIDTGAVLGGVLTCAVLEADTLAFLSA